MCFEKADAYELTGDTYEALGDYVAAAKYYGREIARLEGAVKKPPTEYYTWERLGDVWLKLGKPEQALAIYEKGLQNGNGSEIFRASLEQKLKKVRER